MAKKTIKPGDLNEVPQLVCAAALGITRQTLATLKKSGAVMPIEGKPTTYNLPSAIQQFMEYRNGDETTEHSARTKLYIQQERGLQLKNDETESMLIRAEDVDAAIVELVGALRAGILAMPGRMASQLASTSQPAKCRKLIHAECNQLFKHAEKAVKVLQGPA